MEDWNELDGMKLMADQDVSELRQPSGQRTRETVAVSAFVGDPPPARSSGARAGLLTLIIILPIVSLIALLAIRHDQRNPQLASNEESSSPTSPAPRIAAPSTAAESLPGTPQKPDGNIEPAIDEAVRFLNSNFLVSDGIMGRLEPTEFRATVSEVTFDYDMFEADKPKRHHVARAKTADLDPAAIHDGAGFITIDCKARDHCVSESVTGQSKDFQSVSFGIGPISSGHVEEAEQYLKRILLLGAHESVPEIKRPPTESEIVGFLQSNIPSSGYLGDSDGNMKFFNHSVAIDGDNLIETEDLLDLRTSRPGHLVVTIQISKLDTLVISSGTDVVLVCANNPEGSGLSNCINDNVGDQSSNHVFRNVSNSESVAMMIRELVSLHRPNAY
jgi:hypothetical protein